MEILVFKTNIRNQKQLSVIVPHMNSLQGVQRWNMDMQDRDKILRVQTMDVAPQTIEGVVRKAGYKCEELT